MYRTVFHIILIVSIAVLASCASTAPLTPTPTPLQPTQTTVIFDLAALAPPPGTMNCTLGESIDEPASPLAEATVHDRGYGSEQPSVTIIVYFDPQCPYCAALHPVLQEISREYPTEVRVVYRVFPAFVVHEKALLAAQALEAVVLQDPSAYFSMLDRFFAQQSQWSPMEEDAFSAWLLENVLELGLEREPFESAMLDPTIQDRLLQQLDADLQAGVTYTPYLLINGKTYPNIPRDLNTIRSLVELSLVELRQYGECPPPLLTEGQSYIAVLQTTKGEITVQLFPENAPQAVNNFIFLSEQGWYQDVPFFRVIPGSYALTGDPSGTGLGSPGYTFASEIDPVLSFDRPGVVAMNNTGAPDTNGSAFFITYQALPEFDGAFTIFGQVIDGLDIIQQLTPRDPVNDGEPIQADRLLSVTIQQP